MTRAAIAALATILALVAVVATEGSASADEAVTCAKVDRTNVVQCALRANQGLRADERGVDAARARFVAASPVLPSNPTLSVLGSRRSTADQVVPNWTVSLAQEIEIAGQRGARRKGAVEQESVAKNHLVSHERDVAADALRAWYEALAAEHALALAQQLEANANAVAAAARARADKGLIPNVEADVADAGSLHATQIRLDFQQRVTSSRSTLAMMVGRSPAAVATIGAAPSGDVTVAGELTPLVSAEASASTLAAERPEIAELDARRRAFEDQASLLRRSRVPNVTISAFAQNDALNDRLFGFGLSIPIPLPQPVGHTNAGEIAEAEAEAARSRSEAANVTRELDLRRALAATAYETSRTKLASYTPDRVANAQRQLASIAQEVEAGRLGLRDAIVTQLTLVELLQAHIEVERSLCLASVELARASGVHLEENK